MTTVYTSEAWSHGRFPSSGSVVMEALDLVTQGLSTALVSRDWDYSLYSAGSTIRSSATAASDLDLVLIVSGDEIDFGAAVNRCSRFMASFARWREVGLVPIDLTIESEENCLSGRHGLGYGYPMTLRERFLDGWSTDLGIPFLVYPDPIEVVVRRELADYIQHKIRKLTKGLCFDWWDISSPASMELLADGLDAPFHVLRRWRTYLGLEHCDLGRRELIDEATSLYLDNPHLIVHLEDICRLRDEYVAILTDGHPTKDDYGKILERLRWSAWKTLEWLRLAGHVAVPAVER